MFEKEAKERAEEIEAEQTLGVYDNDEDLARDEGWNDGYVSGYEEGFQDGAEFGYNKANEWHYVKDGDFPKEKTEKKYLVALKSEYSGFFYETDIWCESLHCFASKNPTKVYAWKEIVLPKESE